VVEIGSLIPRGAFDDVLSKLAIGPAGYPLLVSERKPGLAVVMARAGGGEALPAALGADLPARSQRSTARDVALVGTGPGVWLAVKDDAEPAWAARLAEKIGDAASVSDQSSGYAVLRLRGSAARELLSRGAFIDFEPPHFVAGSAAVTVIAHIGVILWQLDDAPTYEVALFRSYADSFWHWVKAASAGMGLEPLRG
jgi:heterotetrameric sarcosine oxidase gamma subunit